MQDTTTIKHSIQQDLSNLDIMFKQLEASRKRSEKAQADLMEDLAEMRGAA